MLTRRGFCGCALGTLGLTALAKRLPAAAVSTLQVDTLLARTPLGMAKPLLRHYRADVVVTLLGLPIFSRRNVGAGFAALRETVEDQRSEIGLHLAGCSNPARTHGLHYHGSIEEVAVCHGGVSVEAAYFGFVTTSNDEKFEQARQTFLAPAKTPTFVAAEGLHRIGQVRCEKGSVSVPDQAWPDLAGLIQEVRTRFFSADRSTKELQVPGTAAAATFLHSSLTAVRSGKASSELDYIHNAANFRLNLEKAPDPHTGAVFAANRLTACPNSVSRFTGHVRELATHKVTTFRFWLDDQSALPLRIELQPRSYLRINLEIEPLEDRPRGQRTEET
jgi:hypothetical protein